MQKQLGDNQTLVGVGVHWFTVQTSVDEDFADKWEQPSIVLICFAHVCDNDPYPQHFAMQQVCQVQNGKCFHQSWEKVGKAENPTRILSGFSVFDGKSNTDLVWIFHWWKIQPGSGLEFPSVFSNEIAFDIFCTRTTRLVFFTPLNHPMLNVDGKSNRKIQHESRLDFLSLMENPTRISSGFSTILMCLKGDSFHYFAMRQVC